MTARYDITDYGSDETLRMGYLRGESRTLVVSVSGVGGSPATVPPWEFLRMAAGSRRDHVLFVADASRSWLNAEGMADRICSAVDRLSAEIGADRIVALGNSMGGTVALHLANLMEFHSVFALTPQYSVDPRVVPGERRWRHYRSAISAFRFPEVVIPENSTTQRFVLHGDAPAELLHALRFPVRANLLHFILPDQNHYLAAGLRESGRLSLLVQLAVAGKRWRFRQVVEDLGGELRTRFQRRDRSRAA